MSESMKILAFIPARGGSKGLPGKALKDLGGYPLISYTIKDALKIEGHVRIFVSTDNDDIGRASLSYGADVPFLRPPALAEDHSRLEDALAYSLEQFKIRELYEPDILIVMSPTYPFRRVERINRALEKGYENQWLFNIGSVAPVNMSMDCMMWKTPSGFEKIIWNNPIEPGFERLVQACLSFNIVFRHRADMDHFRVPVEVDTVEAIDIDTPEDLMIARQVIREGAYPF